MKRKLADYQVAAMNLVDLADRTESMINELPQSGLGIVGKGARGLDQLASELVGLSEIMGGTAEIDGSVVPEYELIKNIDIYDLGELAGASAAVKSNKITLGYLKARSMEPSGRLSKEDVQLAIDSLGGNWSSKAQIRASLNEVRWQAINGLKNFYRAAGMIEEFPADLWERLDSMDPASANKEKEITKGGSTVKWHKPND